MESVEQNNSKKKLIVPLIALMLCAVAVIGIGYGLNSTSTNTNNAVSGNALVVDLTDGNASLASGEFSTKTTLEYKTVQNDGETTVSLDNTTELKVSDSLSYSGVKIGEGTLKVNMQNSSSTSTSSSVNVSVNVSKTGGTIPAGMQFILAAGSTYTVISTDGSTFTPYSGTIPLSGTVKTNLNGSEVFALYVAYNNNIGTSGASLSIPDYTSFTYEIVFTVTN